MRQPFRLLVTGSRTGDDAGTIEQALAVILDRHPEGVLLVHGAVPAEPTPSPPPMQPALLATGSRRIRRTGAGTDELPGYRRNAEMIALGADGCAAFIRGGSPGSTIAVRLARRRLK